jgi:hypothetical protein
VSAYNDEKLAELLRALPAAPKAWVRAAQEFGRSRPMLADLVERAKTDDRFRKALIANPGAAHEAEGYEIEPDVIAAIMKQLD